MAYLEYVGAAVSVFTQVVLINRQFDYIRTVRQGHGRNSPQALSWSIDRLNSYVFSR